MAATAESLREEVGDIYFLYLGRIATANSALDLVKNYGAILKWFQDFDVKYPNFKLWAIKIAGMQKERLIYAEIGDELNFFKTIKEMEKLVVQMEEFWRDQGHSPSHRSDLHQSTLLKMSTYGLELTQEQNTVLDFAWYSRWAEPLADASLTTEATLLRWLKNDATKGKLTQTQLKTILRFEGEPEEEIDVYHLASQLTPERLSFHLHGCSSSPISSASWVAIYPTLHDWLIDNADYDEGKRHYLIMKLQEDRVNKPWLSASDRVTECENLIALGSRLNAAGALPTIFDLGLWLEHLGTLKVARYAEKHGHMFENEEIPEFGEILDHYNTALEYNRQRGHLHLQATVLICVAQLYFCAAQKLRPAALLAFRESLDSAENIYERMREGWKYLRGWDKVEKLLFVSQDFGRLLIFSYAIRVYCQFPESHSQVRDELIWSNIQAAKSIGLGWLMVTNGLDQPERVSVESLEHSSDFKALPKITVEEMQIISNDAVSDVFYVDWYNGSCEAQKVSQLLIVTTSQGKSPQASLVEMTWD